MTDGASNVEGKFINPALQQAEPQVKPRTGLEEGLVSQTLTPRTGVIEESQRSSQDNAINHPNQSAGWWDRMRSIGKKPH